MQSDDPNTGYDGDGSPYALPGSGAMDRRKFLQHTAGGMLLSVFTVRTAGGTVADDVTLASDGFALTLQVPDDGQALMRSLKNVKTGFQWCQPDTPFEPVLVAGGASQTGWQTRQQKHTSKRNRFEFSAEHTSGVVSARHTLQGVADAPFVELQAEFQTAAQPLKAVSAFGAMRFHLRDGLGEVKLRRAGSGVWVLDAVGRGEYLVLGMEFGSAVCRLEQRSNERWLNLEVSGVIEVPGATVAPFTHDLAAGERLPAPRVFLGAFHGDLEGALLATQHYLQRRVFPAPVKNWPWVEYGMWATEPHGVEDALYKEVDVAAEIGFDVVTHDAGWYTGSAKDGSGNWSTGLGHYTDDREKFPHGLVALSRRVHEKGMKFGLWVGPNVVDPRSVGSVISERWLCLMDGKRQVQDAAFGPQNAPVMVCLGCREYAEYIKKEVVGIVKRYNVDLLRWDDSGMNGGCNRTDHGHQAGDWGYAWQQARYEIWEHLLAKFPNLVIEACSAIDAGAMRSVRMFGGIWGPPALQMGPSALPTSYVDCFLEAELDDDGAPRGSKSPAAIDTTYRRFMLSKWCVGTLQGKLSGRFSLRPEPLVAGARRNIPLYKQFRHLLNYDQYHLVLPPVGANPEELWEVQNEEWGVHQFVSPAGDEAVVLAFRNNSSERSMQVPLRALRAERSYKVTSANTGNSMTMRGADLLQKGLSCLLADVGMSEVFLLES